MADHTKQEIVDLQPEAAADQAPGTVEGLVQETTDALARLDERRLAILVEAAEDLRRKQAETPVPVVSRVSQAAAQQVTALRELMRYTSERLSLLERIHTQGRDASDAEDLNPSWSQSWAR